MLCHCELPDSFFKTITRASIIGLIISILAALVISQTDFAIPVSCPSRIGHTSRPAIEALKKKDKKEKLTNPIVDHVNVEENFEPSTSAGYAVMDTIQGAVDQSLRERKASASWWSTLIGAVTMYVTLIVCTLAGH